jgi:hypothetical protein
MHILRAHSHAAAGAWAAPQVLYRGLQDAPCTGDRPAVPLAPAWHHGRFQDCALAYAGKVDVIVTDPPYGKRYLPIYSALADFALTVLVPGGWLVCLSGWDEHQAVMQAWAARPDLHYVTVGTYIMQGRGGKVSRRLPGTGGRAWQQHAKPILVYERHGTLADRRRGSFSDVILIPPTGAADLDQQTFKWQQSLMGFERIISNFTGP